MIANFGPLTSVPLNSSVALHPLTTSAEIDEGSEVAKATSSETRLAVASTIAVMVVRLNAPPDELELLQRSCDPSRRSFRQI